MDVVIIGSDLLLHNDRLQPHPSETPPEKPRASGEVEEEGSAHGKATGGGGRGGGGKKPRHVVFVSARVHPGESPASYMCHGLLDFLIGTFFFLFFTLEPRFD